MKKTRSHGQRTQSVATKTQQPADFPDATRAPDSGGLLKKLINRTGKEIAAILEVTYNAYRHILLSSSNRGPRTVEVEVSRKLVEEWGLDPWDFWCRRKLSSLLGLPVDLVWIAVWRSTEDELRSILQMYPPALPGHNWERHIMARCHLARQRYSWICDQHMELVWQHVGGDAGKFDADDFPLGSISFRDLNTTRPFEAQKEFIELVNLVREACPAKHPTPTEYFHLARELRIEAVTIYCWRSAIIQESKGPRRPASRR